MFTIFVIMPIVEMSILFSVGQRIGALNTIGLVMLTAVIGSAMLRQQGLNTLFKAREKMAVGEMPAKEMAEGILLAVGGAFLITPGFVTDVVGFLCLFPLTRQWFIGRLINSAASAAYFSQSGVQMQSFSDGHQRGESSNETRFESGSQSPFSSKEQSNSSNTLEGEFRQEDE